MKSAVLIHGLSESRAVWGRQEAYLRSFVHVLSYDVRGFGSSPVGDANGTVDQMAADLAKIISANGNTPAWLIGFSMGGVIAQRFALDFPDMVAGLVLIASSCKVGHAGQAFFHDRIGQVSTGGRAKLDEINRSDSNGCIAIDDKALVAEYQQLRVGSSTSVEGYLNACRAMLRLADQTMLEDLGRISCATAVMTGELDPYCPPRASEMIANAIPGAELTVIAGAGHCVHWEQPEVTNEFIHEFIQRHSHE